MFSLTLITILFMVGAMLSILSVIISEKSYFDREKASPFECGFNPVATSRLPFSLRFFVIAMIFLVFDVEIVLLLPLSSTWDLSNLNLWLLSYLFFLVVLLLGTLYEWSYGALNWKMWNYSLIKNI
uniref:NADH-ubiquinone oxidoreductase chain 3 n=1 Tax=Proasellus solanasi TaxID=1282031 RepID=A0A485M8E2_9CRUS|nr:NADH dehydrogenase subunit 3 [Proasellus solanasi]